MLNLTQHTATPDQGCIELNPNDRIKLKELLTFEELPSEEIIIKRAFAIADMASLYEEINPLTAMIGGAPFLMPQLAEALKIKGIKPYYAFSKRVSVSFNGIKKSIFKHIDFIEA